MRPYELIDRGTIEARAALAMARRGVIGVERPGRVLQILRAMQTYGPLGSIARVAAIRHGDRPAIADDRGELTFAQLDEQVNRLTNALRAMGVGSGSGVGILCGNHRGPLIAAFAAARAGADLIWLNTAFSARQCAEVAAREGVHLLVHDTDLAELVAGVEPRHGAFACDINAGDDELGGLIAAGDPAPPPRPGRGGRIVLLTSGTTGTPKGAPRSAARSLALPGGVLERVPLRPREATVIAPPLFHGTGLGAALLSLALGSKVVLRCRFDPAQLLVDTEAHRATSWCVVPVMLQRVLALGEDEIAGRDLTSLRVVICGGSQLPAELAARVSDVLGEVIYNGYGSTEVSIATFATPEDVRTAPASVGRPLLGVRIKLFDDRGTQVATGDTGRIFIGTTTPFEGYTGGGGKEIIGGLMSTGDVGHFDAVGRLYIDGRDDEMIVSGGENVFPREVEELLVTHPAIADAAAIGVDDGEFGQRLRAFVVTNSGDRVDADEVKAFVKDNLARYKVPRDVVFLPELPRNPTGKILKRELATIEA